MRWHLLQAVVAFAVLSANIYWDLTPNPMIAGGWAVMAAIAVTWIIAKGFEVREMGLAAVVRGLRKKT
jgi:hypothetical protein